MWIWIAISVAIFVGGPLLVQYGHFIPGSRGNGDWLSFWGSYLGIIPSGLIAYAVARVQIDKQRENDSELIFKPARPLFKILYSHKEEYADTKGFPEYLPVFDGANYVTYRKETIIIKNISDNNLLGISVFVVYKNTTYDIYRIDKLRGNHGMILSEIKDDVDKVIIYFNTDLREIIRLTFIQEDDDTLNYDRKDKFIENKNKIFPTKDDGYIQYDSQYNLNNFTESLKKN